MKPENVKCPKCGGPMVSKQNGATGQRFWGCQRFPMCNGTRNTDGDAPGEVEHDDDDEYREARRGRGGFRSRRE